MIAHYLWRIIGGVSRRSLVVPVPERGIKNRIVRGVSGPVVSVVWVVVGV
jgi:hypothetical protein